jgi:hypothetical protein
MAMMTIQLRRDPQTGKQNIIVKLDSDADALPMEHEQMHRQLVEALLGKGIDAEDLGEIVIEREAAPSPAVPSGSKPSSERAKSAEGR